MLNIYITNVFCYVNGYDSKAYNAIVQALKYEKKNVYGIKKGLEKRYGKNNKKVYQELEKYKYGSLFQNNMFLTGLLDRVTKMLDKVNVSYQLIDKREKPIVELKNDFPFKLYDYQEKAVDYIIKNKRVIVQIPTGGGKSLLGIAAIYKLNLPTLWLTHKLDLVYQIYDDFTKFFDKKNIGIVGDGQCDFRHITIGTVQTLNSMIKKYGEDMLEEMKKFNVLVEDEAHRSSSKSFVNVSNYCLNAYYRIGLTATPFMKTEEENMLLEGVISKNVFIVEPEDLIRNNILARPYVYYQQIDGEIYGSEWDEIYTNGIVNYDLRNAYIVKYALERIIKGDNILIIVLHIEHGKKLYEMLKDSCKVQFVSGEDDARIRRKGIEDLENNRLNCLIATNIFDEGVNIQNINCVILAGGGKSAPALFQRIGRGMRAKTKDKVLIIDFIDKQHKLLFKHSMERMQMIKNKKGYVIINNIKKYEEE